MTAWINFWASHFYLFLFIIPFAYWGIFFVIKWFCERDFGTFDVSDFWFTAVVTLPLSVISMIVIVMLPILLILFAVFGVIFGIPGFFVYRHFFLNNYEK